VIVEKTGEEEEEEEEEEKADREERPKIEFCFKYR
jgi:hypothetical protein